MALPFIFFTLLCTAGSLILGYYIGLAENDKDRKVLTEIQTYCLQLRAQGVLKSMVNTTRADVGSTILKIIRNRNEIPKRKN